MIEIPFGLSLFLNPANQKSSLPGRALLHLLSSLTLPATEATFPPSNPSHGKTITHPPGAGPPSSLATIYTPAAAQAGIVSGNRRESRRLIRILSQTISQILRLIFKLNLFLMCWLSRSVALEAGRQTVVSLLKKKWRITAE